MPIYSFKLQKTVPHHSSLGVTMLVPWLLLLLSLAAGCPLSASELWTTKLAPLAPITVALIDAAIAQCKAEDRCIPSSFSETGASLMAHCDADHNGVLDEGEFVSCEQLLSKPRLMRVCKTLDCYLNRVKK